MVLSLLLVRKSILGIDKIKYVCYNEDITIMTEDVVEVMNKLPEGAWQ